MENGINIPKLKNRNLLYADLGLIDYKDAWDLQKHTFELRYQKKISDIIYLLEHPHTYTLGKVADEKNLIGSKEYLDKKKISVYNIDRGGDITYHGPGQIVGSYCMKCRTKREMKDPKSITMKNGKPATQGNCPVCGTKMFRIGKS